MSIILTKFGVFCNQRRSETCRTLAMMAEAIGMEAEYLSGIEHGDIPTTETHVEKVGEYFNLPYEYLLPYAFPERYVKSERTENDQPTFGLTPSNVISLDEHRPA